MCVDVNRYTNNPKPGNVWGILQNDIGPMFFSIKNFVTPYFYLCKDIMAKVTIFFLGCWRVREID